MSLFDALSTEGATRFFTPPAALLEALVHSTDGFHVIVGLDAFGTFTGVRGLQAETPVFTYEEMGRNGHPVQLPFDGPRKMGEVTLEWGTILRTRFWNWFTAQTPYFAEPQPVFIVHLSRRTTPIRVFLLWGAWPRQWSYADLGTNEMAVESVTIVYDRLFVIPTALLGLAPELSKAVATSEVAEEGRILPPTSLAETSKDPKLTAWAALPEEERKKQPEPPETPAVPVPWLWEPTKKKGERKTDPRKPPVDTKPRDAWAALPEDRAGKAGAFLAVPIPQTSKTRDAIQPHAPVAEDYEGKLGTWGTEALAEEYVGRAGTWGGALAGAWRTLATPGIGDGKSVDEEDDR